MSIFEFAVNDKLTDEVNDGFAFTAELLKYSVIVAVCSNFGMY